MSIFSPLDPRGPDQRRKQLIAKLAGQAGAAQQATSQIPMPARLGGAATMAEGRSFHGASSARLGGAAHVTQSPNILSSVMQRLGVLGKSHAEEMSGGRGLPIAPIARGPQSPVQNPGSAIPTAPMTPTGAPTGTVGAIGAGNANNPAAPTPDTPLLDQQGQAVTTTSDSGLLTHSDGAGGSYAPILEHGAGTTSPGPVPLGNGLYYDPETGTILGQQDVNPTIPGARPGMKSAF